MRLKLAVAIISAMMLLASCSQGFSQARIISHADNVVTFELDGYAYTCARPPKVFEVSGMSWKEVDQSLPPNGVFFLDDQWRDDRGIGCDIADCQPVKNPFSATLVKYEKVGERNPPVSYVTGLVPEFRSVPLRGKLRITVESYRDKDCQQKREVNIFVEN
jgi:hypothetical protein